MTTRCKTLTIFEGPDGSGKTTLAKRYAEHINGVYVHFPALKEVGLSLPRLYVEAMLPALHGYQHVVWDRSWLSEPIYGTVFRGGKDRVGPYHQRMLERLAMRCGGVVVRCDPGWLRVRESFIRRREQEMLADLQQLEDVWRLYRRLVTDLPTRTFDYEKDTPTGLFEALADFGPMCHLLRHRSAGNLGARVALVGDEFGERKDQDPWYQWPFASFSGGGCSQWLAAQLRSYDIPESQLLWLNKADVELLHTEKPNRVIALGKEAAAELYRHKISAAEVPHPQYWKRFHANETYPLFDLIRP